MSKIVSLMMAASHLPAEQGGCVGCLGLSWGVFFIFAIPIMFIYSIIDGNGTGIVLFGFLTALIVIVILSTLFSEYYKKRTKDKDLKKIDEKMKKEWVSDHIHCLSSGVYGDWYQVTFEINNIDGKSELSFMGKTVDELDKKMIEEINLENEYNKKRIEQEREKIERKINNKISY